MQRLLKKNEYPQPYLEYGMVVEAGDLLRVETALGSYTALKAASCLVRPKQGDSVLAAFDGEGNCFILSVLVQNQAAGQINEIILEGDASLHIRRGGLTISADDEVSVVSDRLSLAARTGNAAFEECSFLGKSLFAEFGTIKTIAGKVENIFQQFTEKLIDAFRFVKDHEEIQTGSTRYLVDTNLTMHSKNAMHVAEEIVTINAGQVHLG
ncbi:MAG TPA: hypothetical protein DCG53_01240 [Syntrophus sp. (in: bacteria)]|jgi:hypothetical protein|nr:hypothetical protein [Syntrophus sp. (in: bacteria)]